MQGVGGRGVWVQDDDGIGGFTPESQPGSECVVLDGSLYLEQRKGGVLLGGVVTVAYTQLEEFMLITLQRLLLEERYIEDDVGFQKIIFGELASPL